MAGAAVSKILMSIIGRLVTKHGLIRGISEAKKFGLSEKNISQGLKSVIHQVPGKSAVMSSKIPKQLNFQQRKAARIREMMLSQGQRSGGMSDRQRMAEVAGMVDPNRRLRRGEF
jgi:hypothetical protein